MVFVIGASYGVYKELCRMKGEEPKWNNIEELKESFKSLQITRLAAATDGILTVSSNHHHHHLPFFKGTMEELLQEWQSG